MSTKADDALKTISEVSELLDVPPHVLRFWEGKFVSLHPLKRSGGRRYYRPNDIDLLRRIRKLLYVDGFTIKGAQKLIRSKAFWGILMAKGMMRRLIHRRLLLLCHS